MSTQNGGPVIVKNGLSLYVDPANYNTYNGGIYVYDLIGSTGLTFSFENGALFDNVNNGTFQFDGVTSTTASVVSSNLVYPMSAKMSWDVWFKRTNDGNMFNIVYSNNLPYLSFRGTGSGVNTNLFLFSWYTSFGGVATQRSLYTLGTYSNNIWYNVVCTLDQNLTSTASTVNMYVDGSFINTITTAVGTVDAVFQPTIGNRLLLGNFSSPRYPFTGNIGAFKVYNRILSASEILQNYNTLKSRYQN